MVLDLNYGEVSQDVEILKKKGYMVFNRTKGRDESKQILRNRKLKKRVRACREDGKKLKGWEQDKINDEMYKNRLARNVVRRKKRAHKQRKRERETGETEVDVGEMTGQTTPYHSVPEVQQEVTSKRVRGRPKKEEGAPVKRQKGYRKPTKNRRRVR